MVTLSVEQWTGEGILNFKLNVVGDGIRVAQTSLLNASFPKGSYRSRMLLMNQQTKICLQVKTDVGKMAFSWCRIEKNEEK
jgi:hypothetical protein